MSEKNIKKVLLLDTAFAAVPIYEYLIQNGNQVWVMGNRKQDALAIRAGEFWIEQDYSQIKEVEKHIEKYDIEYVVPGCTDTSIEVCLQLGMNSDILDTITTYNKLGNKKEFRRICAALDLPSPQIVSIDDFPMEGRYICKPVDAFSGRGVTVVDGTNMNELKNAYQHAVDESISSKAIIETYVDGQLYSFSAFIENLSVAEYFLVKEGSSINPYAVDTSYVDTTIDKSVTDLLKSSIEKLCKALELKDGLLHLQFILEDNKPYMIEVSRRAPGDLYSLLIEYTTGFKYAAKYASYFISETYDTGKRQHKNIIRHTIASSYLTSFLSLKFVSSLQVHTYFPLLSLGNRVLPQQQTRVGLIFSETESHEMLELEYKKFIERKMYQIDTL